MFNCYCSLELSFNNNKPYNETRRQWNGIICTVAKWKNQLVLLLALENVAQKCRAQKKVAKTRQISTMSASKVAKKAFSLCFVSQSKWRCVKLYHTTIVDWWTAWGRNLTVLFHGCVFQAPRDQRIVCRKRENIKHILLLLLFQKSCSINAWGRRPNKCFFFLSSSLRKFLESYFFLLFKRSELVR